ncbi:cell wall glycosyl hydrolase [Niveomyces insectorum RCEF 264]|uniref:Mannan endo-1,6-alpha-mannosidase n=1 Tax=Niveomyces insectorum RCEF 264 TaxID=1081102 RepID=A0A167N2I1_9HYPO|nr:cell wall glycosyl hydrolase [Niveomyces insectorum RCEF 264]
MVLFRVSLWASAAAAAVSLADPKDLQVDNHTSIKGVAKTLAEGAMSYYRGDAKTYVDLPSPYYWWECGALFGAMLDYSHYTNDTVYDETIATALLAQAGPNYDFIVPSEKEQEGNDDQAFWGFTLLTAAERDFPQPAHLTPPGMPSWLQLGINLWNNMAGRWNTSKCDGGLTWQIYASNYNGINYKNSVSNGGFFQLSARLARLTGNETYVDWAVKVWDWTVNVGLIDGAYNVYDGTDSTTDCTDINTLSFSYANGIYLYGAAVMANHTGLASWTNHATKLFTAAQAFFSPFANATNIMWEHACEGVGTCDTDMKSFKGYLSRFMVSSSLLLPSLAPNKWYVGGFDGSVGLGQEMSALETIQGLLVLHDDVLDPNGNNRIAPTAASTTSAAPAPSQSKKSGASRSMRATDLCWVVLGVFSSLFVWGMA